LVREKLIIASWKNDLSGSRTIPLRMTAEAVQIRIHGTAELPTLIYLPGLHGNWMLIGGLRRALGNDLRFVEISYPSTLRWSIEDHAVAVEEALNQTEFMKVGYWGIVQFPKSPGLLIGRGRLQVKGIILAGGSCGTRCDGPFD